MYFPTHEVVGDIANAIWQLKEKLEPNADWEFSQFLKVKVGGPERSPRSGRGPGTHARGHVWQAEIAADISTNVDSDAFPIKPQRIVHDVRQVVKDDGILCLDNGMYKLWFARHYPAYVPNTLLLDNALATMGAGLPSAIAAKLMFPERQVGGSAALGRGPVAARAYLTLGRVAAQVIAVCGDGGFMMNSQELETAVRLLKNLVVLLINDNAFGMIKVRSGARRDLRR